MELAPDFNEFFELLNAHRVEYVLVGGYALALHGAPRIVAPSCLIQMGTPPVQLHVMSAIDGVTWEQVWDGHEVAILVGRAIPFIGREAFLQNKRAVGRTKDLADIEAIGGLTSPLGE